MLESRPLRRVLATGTAVGIAAALALLPAAAEAKVAAKYVAAGSSSSNYIGATSGATCDLRTGDDDNPQTSEADFSNGTRRRSVDLDTHYTNSANTADTVHVKGHLDTKLTIDRPHRDLRSFDFGAGGTLKVIHSLARSDCQTSGSLLGESMVTFTEHHKGHLYVTRDTAKPNSVVAFVLVNLKTQKLVTFEEFAGGKSHATSRALLKPGTYAIEEMVVGLSVGDTGIPLKSGRPAQRSVTLTTTLHGEFKRKK